MKKRQRLYLPIKRIIDVLVSSFSLVLLAPIFIFIAIAIKIDSKGPVLFKQKRIGINNIEFHILKFRTMKIEAPKDAPTDQLHNATSWITRTGKIFRKTSIDELPQLINILKGEMSIVGPRPALWNQHFLNELRTSHGIHKIKPGLTGWAQINGRDENNDVEKTHWDKEYLMKYSLIFDIKCILKTVYSVFNSKGVVEGGKINVDKNINNW